MEQIDYNTIDNTFRPKLKVLFYKQLSDKDIVEDLVQDTLLKVYTNLSSYDDKYSIHTWVYTIAFNTLKNYFKHHTRSGQDRTTYSDDIRDNEHTELLNNPLDILVADEMERDHNNFLSNLNPDFLSAYILKTVDDLSYEDISIQLNIPVGTVKSRVNRVKKNIQKVLES